MEISEPSGQNRLTVWNLVIGSIVCSAAYFAGYPSLVQGILFGLVLMSVNFRALSTILNMIFRFASFDIARVLAFVSYHIRFWILVLIMFLVIPKTDMYFGIGTFIGLLIPKLSLGIAVLQKRDEEWWTKSFAAGEPPEPVISYLEKELAAKNPFTVDPIGIEVENYIKKTRENKKNYSGQQN